MSDTPRTDAEWRHYVREGYRDAGQSFARTLERELAATQHLLHESLAREDRFYRELAAKDKEASK